MTYARKSTLLGFDTLSLRLVQAVDHVGGQPHDTRAERLEIITHEEHVLRYARTAKDLYNTVKKRPSSK